MYICPSSAIDRALVSGMSISVNIFYFHSKPLPFMLQEATQPTAKQKKVGDPEQELKGCCNRGLSRSLAVSPKNQETLCIYIFFQPSVYNIFYLHSNPAVPFHFAANCTADCMANSRIRAKPATSKALPNHRTSPSYGGCAHRMPRISTGIGHFGRSVVAVGRSVLHGVCDCLIFLDCDLV